MRETETLSKFLRDIPDGVDEGSHTPTKFDSSTPNLGRSALTVKPDVVPRARYKPSTKLTPQLNEVLNEAHNIALNQLIVLRHKSEMGELNADEVTQFAKLADAVSKLDRTSREREKMRDPNEMTDAELLELAEKAKEVLGRGKGETG